MMKKEPACGWDSDNKEPVPIKVTSDGQVVVKASNLTPNVLVHDAQTADSLSVTLDCTDKKGGLLRLYAYCADVSYYVVLEQSMDGNTWRTVKTWDAIQANRVLSRALIGGANYYRLTVYESFAPPQTTYKEVALAVV